MARRDGKNSIRGGWNVALSTDDNGIIAALPYFYKVKHGIKYIVQPPLTQHCGLYLPISESWKNEKKYQVQQEHLSELIAEIETDENDVVYYKQNLPHYCNNGLPYYWKGYKLETRYTYIINCSRLSYDQVTQAYSKVIRYDIKKQRRLAI